jgi:hypothetical protein
MFAYRSLGSSVRPRQASIGAALKGSECVRSWGRSATGPRRTPARLAAERAFAPAGGGVGRWSECLRAPLTIMGPLSAPRWYRGDRVESISKMAASLDGSDFRSDPQVSSALLEALGPHGARPVPPGTAIFGRHGRGPERPERRWWMAWEVAPSGHARQRHRQASAASRSWQVLPGHHHDLGPLVGRLVRDEHALPMLDNPVGQVQLSLIVFLLALPNPPRARHPLEARVGHRHRSPVLPLQD